MFTTLLTILPVFLVIATAFGVARLGFVPEDAAQLLNRIVVWIPMPCLMFHVVAGTDWHSTWNSGFALISLSGSAMAFLLGAVIARLRGRGLPVMAIDGLSASYSNAIFIGFPLLSLALGNDTRPYMVVAGTMTLCILLAGATVMIELDASRNHNLAKSIGTALRATFANPIVAAPALGLLWWTTGWTLPPIADNFLTLMGGATTPMALISIGLFLAQRPIGEAFANRPAMALTGIKLLVHPAITLALLMVIPLPGRLALVAVIAAALPTGTGPFILNGIYGRDNKVASSTILLSTLFSLLTISALLRYFSV